ncbi:hypothetical protein B0F90DRAFT_1824313 [Multifurca ochricompacta]|uniref:Uncharacterized protein n=1 Tax=Multifurca ochricompacta TaxID=376703 RepID=A0AAD4QEV5_9AGAM|nr:hypothetical protein B0F90DRAFT_1824313 [Multifurca ochricompacta]
MAYHYHSDLPLPTSSFSLPQPTVTTPPPLSSPTSSLAPSGETQVVTVHTDAKTFCKYKMPSPRRVTLPLSLPSKKGTKTADAAAAADVEAIVPNLGPGPGRDREYEQEQDNDESEGIYDGDGDKGAEGAAAAASALCDGHLPDRPSCFHTISNTHCLSSQEHVKIRLREYLQKQRQEELEEKEKEERRRQHQLQLQQQERRERALGSSWRALQKELGYGDEEDEEKEEDGDGGVVAVDEGDYDGGDDDNGDVDGDVDVVADKFALSSIGHNFDVPLFLTLAPPDKPPRTVIWGAVPSGPPPSSSPSWPSMWESRWGSSSSSSLSSSSLPFSSSSSSRPALSWGEWPCQSFAYCISVLTEWDAFAIYDLDDTAHSYSNSCRFPIPPVYECTIDGVAHMWLLVPFRPNVEGSMQLTNEQMRLAVEFYDRACNSSSRGAARRSSNTTPVSPTTSTMMDDDEYWGREGEREEDDEREPILLTCIEGNEVDILGLAVLLLARQINRDMFQVGDPSFYGRNWGEKLGRVASTMVYRTSQTIDDDPNVAQIWKGLMSWEDMDRVQDVLRMCA